MIAQRVFPYAFSTSTKPTQLALPALATASGIFIWRRCKKSIIPGHYRPIEVNYILKLLSLKPIELSYILITKYVDDSVEKKAGSRPIIKFKFVIRTLVR